jgi:uncharacterized protein YjbI with pentapeptide repeats
MTTHLYGRTRVELPDIAEHDSLLPTQVLTQGGTTRGFIYEGHNLRDLDLLDAQLFAGQVKNISTQRTALEGVAISSVEFVSSVIGTLAWNGSRTSRTVFRGCKIMAAAISSVTFRDVLFEKCRLDYSEFRTVRAERALVFDRCVLTEAAFTGCDLSNSTFRDCTFEGTQFGEGRYRGCDLRGNDLSAIRGAAALQGVVIDRLQTEQLTASLMSELDVTFGEDLDGREGTPG